MTLSPKTNLLRAIHHEDPHHVPYAGEGAYRLVDHYGRKPPREGLDEWGVRWAPLPATYVASRTGSAERAGGAGEPLDSFPAAPRAASAAELQRLAFPDSGDPCLFAGLLEGVDGAQTLAIGQHPAGILDRFLLLLGMQRGLTALLTEPEASGQALERIADYHADLARGYIAAGVEAAWLADDYAGQDGPYVRPTLWERMIMPALARVIAVYRANGLPVLFHTCGKAEAFVPGLLDAGVSVLNLQSEACNLAALKARFHRRIAFFGGVPSQMMLTGTPNEIRQAVRSAIAALAWDGGLILAPDQPLAYPAENQSAMVEAAREYGRTWKEK
jgi:uroporphyrinogen decarboxylase